MELDKRFNFKEIDQKWSKLWEERKVFHAKADTAKTPYTIMIPPPNVTGILHMGHALNNTLQDIIIRYKRMKGFATLWMPGTDHAGIATQNVVEKQLASEGKTRHDLSREEFVKRLWEWKDKYGDTIIHQLKKLGASCDWSRTRFTMDDDYSFAVRSVFVKLYEKGLIYRGQYIINWCPRCHTALSDEEAEHEDTNGHLYFIKYPFKDKATEFLTVATTRPETMLGDTAVAVNPKDKRYKKFVGKTLILPLMNREIPVIADDFVDSQFGTGAVKVTPAHDPNDFEMGKRHDLPFINIMHENATLNENAGAYKGMDRFKARQAILEELKKRDLLKEVKDHPHAVGHCYRCHTVVEPYLSHQWFVKMKPLAASAIKVVKNGKVKFAPARWEKVYLNWMENIRDWCISRQIWWGHRIPVWYCQNKQAHCAPIVSLKDPSACPHCGSKDIKQDPDVLDTWFSSWLWPFATLGWPKENADLKYFYPTSSLFTAPEIIFFWVARMIMAGLEFMGDVPFSDVYIHGTVRDAKGRKMSKSLGNAIDPLEIIEEYGADALRFSLIINSGQDLFIAKDKFEIGRNFANKIWNASRLILMNVKDTAALGKIEASIKNTDLANQWIISRLQTTIKDVGAAIENYRYSEAETLIYDFFWGNFCDWYLEIIKDRWDDPMTQNVSLTTLVESLKIMHPFIPFVTEELYSLITKATTPLCLQEWPQVNKKHIDVKIEKKMQVIIDLVTAIRNLRSQWNVKPKEPIDCYLSSSDQSTLTLLEENKETIKNLCQIAKLEISKKTQSIPQSATVVVHDIKGIVPLGSIIDLDKEKRRITDQINEQQGAIDSLTKRLANKSFLTNAPKDVVEKEKDRLQAMTKKIAELSTVIKSLK